MTSGIAGSRNSNNNPLGQANSLCLSLFHHTCLPYLSSFSLLCFCPSEVSFFLTSDKISSSAINNHNFKLIYYSFQACDFPPSPLPCPPPPVHSRFTPLWSLTWITGQPAASSLLPGLKDTFIFQIYLIFKPLAKNNLTNSLMKIT